MSISYEIDGEIYEQKPLVLGQMGQLTELLKGVVIPPDINRLGVISLLGNKLPAALAVVLTPKGCKVRDKDIEAVEKELEFSMSPEIAIQVIEDFFTCNPIQSLLEQIGGMVEKITEQIEIPGSTNSSASSQAETSPKEKKSSGDTP